MICKSPQFKHWLFSHLFIYASIPNIAINNKNKATDIAAYIKKLNVSISDLENGLFLTGKLIYFFFLLIFIQYWYDIRFHLEQDAPKLNLLVFLIILLQILR